MLDVCGEARARFEYQRIDAAVVWCEAGSGIDGSLPRIGDCVCVALARPAADEVDPGIVESGISDRLPCGKSLCRRVWPGHFAQNGVIEVAVLKTMGDLPENVHVIATDVAPTVALYDPKAGLLNEVIGDTVTIEQLSNVPLAMEEQYLIPVQNAFKQKGAQLYLKALSSSPYVSAKIAVAGLAVGLVSAHVAYSGLLAGMTVKPIQDGGALTGQYCIAVQQGNYRSQVVNNFLEIVTDAFGLKLIDEPSAPANQEEI